MSNRKDYSGMKFGMLTAIRQSKKRGPPKTRQPLGRIFWDWKCDCGKVVARTADDVMRRARSGGPASCGCAWEKHKLPLGVAARNMLLDKYKRDARRMNRAWKISDEVAIQLFGTDCSYCGVEPSQSAMKDSRGGINGDFIYNGIDRIDSNLGYINGNVVPCCKTCNWMKLAMSVDQFLSHVCRIEKHNR